MKSAKEKLHVKLINLGLTDKESSVYLSALELGTAPVQQIAKGAKINRATTYTIIDSLMKIGLMSTYKEGKKYYFYAEQPEKIVQKLVNKRQTELRAKRKSVSTIIPNLKALESKRMHEKPVLRFYQGKKGIKSLAKELFVGEDDAYRVIYPREKLYNVFAKDFLQKLKKERITKDINSKAICITNNTDLKVEKGKRIILAPEELDISCDIGIYGDHLRIVSLEEPLNGIIISDPHIVETFKTIFDLMYAKLQKQKKDERDNNKE